MFGKRAARLAHRKDQGQSDTQDDGEGNESGQQFAGRARAPFLGVYDRGAEAGFGRGRLAGFDLFDGILGARQADIIIFPVDFDGADLVPADSRCCTSTSALVSSSGECNPAVEAVASRPALSASMAFWASC